MRILFHRNFEKRYQKIRKSERVRFKERIHLFVEDQFDPVLGNHPLRGRYKGYRSINITGDLRAIYRELQRDVFLFVTINTHDKLYTS